MTPKKEYDWIDDPFKEEKEVEKQGMSSLSKVIIGCGCLVVIVVFVVFFIMLISGIQSAMSAF